MAISASGSQVFARPNHSLTPRGFKLLFLAITLIMLSIVVAVIHIGAWFVLPFAGLELLAFGVAFYHIYRHMHDYESITLDQNQVLIEKHGLKACEQFAFQTYWAQVVIHARDDGRQGLFIGSHGKEVEFGHSLITDAQRVQLAKDLRARLVQLKAF